MGCLRNQVPVFCKTGGQHQIPLFNLLHQPSGIPAAGKEAFRRIHLQRNFENPQENEHDPAV